MTSNVNLVPAPPTVRTPPWDGTLSTYQAIRHAVGPTPHPYGCPAFVASMLTASRPGPASLWDGDGGWVQVPLGWTVVVRGGYAWTECPPDDQTSKPADRLEVAGEDASGVGGPS